MKKIFEITKVAVDGDDETKEVEVYNEDVIEDFKKQFNEEDDIKVTRIFYYAATIGRFGNMIETDIHFDRGYATVYAARGCNDVKLMAYIEYKENGEKFNDTMEIKTFNFQY